MFIRKPNSTLFTKCQRVVEWIVAEELAKKKKLELTEHVTSSRDIIQKIFLVGINSLYKIIGNFVFAKYYITKNTLQLR